MSHTATLLLDGRVLVTGGYNPDDPSPDRSKTAEIFDPSTKKWTAVASMADGRSSHTATLLESGKVLVTGGIKSVAPLDTAEIYDPSTNQWTSTGKLSIGRVAHTATRLESGQVLVTGGFGTAAALRACEIYDPALGQWRRTKADLSFPRAQHSATRLDNGRVLIAGGTTSTTTELYQPELDEFVMFGVLAEARSDHTATLLQNNQVLVVSGISGSEQLATAELFDYSTRSWKPAGRSGTAGEGRAAVLLPSGRVLLTAGKEEFLYPASVEVFDPQTGQWAQTGSLSAGRARVPIVLLNTGKALIAGGEAVQDVLDGSELYGVFASPNPTTVAPRESRAFSASSGSGTGYAWSFLTNASGGQLNGTTGAYQAGSTGSVSDVLQVKDSQDNTDTVNVTVTAGVSVLPTDVTVAPRQGVTFTASGGSGTGFAFSFIENGSGAALDPASGSYRAGTQEGTSDTLRIRDSLGNEATARVAVGLGVRISPPSIKLRVKESVSFTPSGGSGNGFTWAFESNGSGATLNPSTGVYTAGNTGGTTDRVGVTDSLGNSATATVNVDGGSQHGGCAMVPGRSPDVLSFLLLFILPLVFRRRMLGPSPQPHRQ